MSFKGLQGVTISLLHSIVLLAMPFAPVCAAAIAACGHIRDNSAMPDVLTIRIDRKTKTRLEKLAKATDRTKSRLAAEAIRAYVDLNEWQIREIKAALKEADAEDFADPMEVQIVLNKWRHGAG